MGVIIGVSAVFPNDWPTCLSNSVDLMKSMVHELHTAVYNKFGYNEHSAKRVVFLSIKTIMSNIEKFGYSQQFTCKRHTV